MKRGFLTDPHACAEELEMAIKWLLTEGVAKDNILLLGDLEDRGPYPAECTRIVRSAGIHVLQGNHEFALYKLMEKREAGEPVNIKPNRDFLKKSLNALKAEDGEYFKNLPRMLLFEDMNILAVHAGLSSYLPWYRQDHLIDHVQLVHPDHPKETRFWGPLAQKKYGKNEDELKAEGWIRWYEIYNHPHNIVFGHSVFETGPLIEERNGQNIYGLDTGCVFGGYLTAMIIDESGLRRFSHVKARKTYFTADDVKPFDFSKFKPVGAVL